MNTLLLTCLVSDFLFLPEVLFWSRSHMTPSCPVFLAPLVVTISQTSLFFDDLDSLAEAWASYAEATGVCLLFFS